MDCEYPECFREVTRTARKQHRCCECRGLITIGTKYQYCSGIWQGDPGDHKTCLPCAQLRKDIDAHLWRKEYWDGGVPFEGIADEIDNSHNGSPEWLAFETRWNVIKLLKLKQQYDSEHGLQNAVQ